MHFSTVFWDIRVQLIPSQRSIFNLSTRTSRRFRKEIQLQINENAKDSIERIEQGI